MIPTAKQGILLLLLVAGCTAPANEGTLPRGSGIVTSAEVVGRLASQDLEFLRIAGVREMYLDAAHLRWEAGRPSILVEPYDLHDAAGPRLPVVLTSSGQWEVLAGSAAADIGEALGEGLRGLRRRATAAGLTVVGLHLDVALPASPDSLAAYAVATEAVREVLPEDVFLAISFDRPTLHSAEAYELAAPADVVVAFLFGPRGDGRPTSRGEEAWRLDNLEDDLARLEDLGRPFLVGIGTTGGVAREGATGELFTATRLGSLLRDRALDPRPAPLFGSAEAQLYPFVARRPTRLGEWDLAAGEEIEARRLAPHHLRALVERVEAAGSPLHLGQLYDRLPRPGEGLALTPAELAAAADPAAAAPRLELVLERAGGRLRVRLAHRGGAATEVAAFDHNYVEVRLAGGSFGAVDPGGFARYELLADGRRAADQAALRRADTLRLYTQFLEAGDEVASGVVRHSGAATATARFLMPDGTVVEAAPEE